MRALVAAVPGTVAALALVVPAAIGHVAQWRYAEAVHAIERAGYRITENEYRRGWLDARAVLGVAPPAEPDPGQPTLRLTSRIEHGPRGGQWHRWPPVLAAVHSRVRAVGGPRRLPPLRVEALGLLGGDLDIDARLPDVAYSGAAGRLRLTQAWSRLKRNAREDLWQGQLHLGGLEAVDPQGGRLALTGIALRAHLRHPGAPVPRGTAELALSGLSLGGSRAWPELDGGEVGLRLVLAGSPTRLAASADASVGRLSVDGENFAPSRAGLTLSDLDVPALESLRRGLTTLNTRRLPEAARGLAIAGLITDAVPSLLAAKPGVRVTELAMTTPSGVVAASGSLVFDGAPPPITAPPAVWLARLSGQGRVSAPQAFVVQLLAGQQRRRAREELRHLGQPADELPPRLVEEVDAAAQASLAALIRDGWLVAADGRLAATASLDGGVLTLNGKALRLAEWGLTGP